MNAQHPARLGVPLAILLAAPLVQTIAQTPAEPFGPMIMEEVIVTAPRILRRQEIDRTSGGARVEEITLTRRVTYEDLDLTMHADVVELERRVDAMAREACETIGEAFRFVDPEPSEAECVRRAIDGATPQIEAAVTAAAD